MSLERLKLTDSWEQDNKIMEAHIKRLATPGVQLQILEAGCGQAWPLDLSGVDYSLTGLDIDKDALEIRVNKIQDLHKGIVGDLRTADFPDASFDVIYCSFVLEHVPGAETVMHNFKQWIKPGGIIILRIPDPESVHGVITRVTPHWFHVLYYRLVLRRRNAGQPGYGPYPVHYDSVIWRSGIHGFCNKNGLVVLAEYGDAYIEPGRGLLKGLINVFKKITSLLSLGHFDHRHTNLMYVIQKQ